VICRHQPLIQTLCCHCRPTSVRHSTFKFDRRASPPGASRGITRSPYVDPSVQSTVLVLRPPIKEDFTTRANEVILRLVEIAIPCESVIWCASRTTSMLKEQTTVLVEIDLEAPPSARSSSHHHRSAAGQSKSGRTTAFLSSSMLQIVVPSYTLCLACVCFYVHGTSTTPPACQHAWKPAAPCLLPSLPCQPCSMHCAWCEPSLSHCPRQANSTMHI
jgi:hypothetical protein